MINRTELESNLLKKTAEAIAKNPAELPIAPRIRRSHPRTGEILILADPRRQHPFLERIRLQLEQFLLSGGFSVRLSPEMPKDGKRIEGVISLLSPSPDSIRALRDTKRCFAFLSGCSHEKNAVSFDPSGAWIRFYQLLLERKIRNVLYVPADDGETICECEPEAAFLRYFPDRGEALEFRRAGELPFSPEKDTLVLTSNAIRQGISHPATATWFLPDSGADFQFVPSPAAASELVNCLYRQLTSGQPSDPGAILPVRLIPAAE